jgi:tRNA pseudouridine38-40 synthase
MSRYKLTLEYDGTGLVGWQRQANGLSVQEVLEISCERLCGQHVTVHGAGRTDAGVHALGQTAHIDLPKDWPTDVIRNALNQHVKPHAVSVLAVDAVDAHFDARRSARGRVYCYRILNRRAPAATTRGHVWHVGPPLDTDAMQAGAQLLLGKHDFSTFRDSECQAKSPVKTLDMLQVTRVGDEVQIEARARSFLHHQVRNMVGSLKMVGLGKWRAQHMREALDACDRRAGGPTAPAEGLYLVEVVYPSAES